MYVPLWALIAVAILAAYHIRAAAKDNTEARELRRNLEAAEDEIKMLREEHVKSDRLIDNAHEGLMHLELYAMDAFNAKGYDHGDPEDKVIQEIASVKDFLWTDAAKEARRTWRRS